MFPHPSYDSGPISKCIQVRLLMRSACSSFCRTRIAVAPISPSSIFASQTAIILVWARSRLSLVILPFQDAPMATATLHDTDRRSSHRVARARRGIRRFVREARRPRATFFLNPRRSSAASSSSSSSGNIPKGRREERGNPGDRRR